MLKRYPTLRYIFTRGGWYIVTFLVAVTLNFFLPRLGAGNPIDIIMAKAGSGLDTKAAQAKEEAYLKEFGLVELDKQQNIRRSADGKPV
jgi:peptide/nickel transport system permease protein